MAPETGSNCPSAGRQISTALVMLFLTGVFFRVILKHLGLAGFKRLRVSSLLSLARFWALPASELGSLLGVAQL